MTPVSQRAQDPQRHRCGEGIVLRAVRENARVRALSRHLALELPATLALLQRLDGPAITAVRRWRSLDPESSS